MLCILVTNGAWRETGKAVGGGVISLTNGHWLSRFSTKFKAISAQAAELYAIREGLMLAKREKISQMEVETDLKILIEHAEDFPHHDINVLNL